jgi:aspartate racemase
MIPEIAERVQKNELKTVGLLGTSRVMQTRLYGGISSASVVVPEGDALDKVHRTYIAMALSGKVTDEQRGELFSIGQSLCRDQGAEVVLLAGTDLFLAFDGRACAFPFMHCAEIHIDALYRRRSEKYNPSLKTSASGSFATEMSSRHRMHTLI